jgi:carbonic anhydrase
MAGPGSDDVPRRGFLQRAGQAGLLAGLAAGSAGAAAMPAAVPAPDDPAAAPGPGQALRLLLEGNQRWVQGRLRHPRQSVAWRQQVARHQDPFATVVCCIDSRVPPEIVFDRGIGDLFVIRTGAQALDDLVVLGSVEFGPVNYASARLLLVLGHQGCGAVGAAIRHIESGQPAPGHIQAVVDALRPAYRAAKGQPGNLMDNMIRVQTRLTVHRLRRDPVLARLTATGQLVIIGGHYTLASGRVQIIA